jgi:peroxiredoxin
MRDFELRSANGQSIRISDYRGRSNLVLIFADGREQTTELLSQLATAYEQVKGEGAEILAIGRGSREQCATTKEHLRLPFPVLADEDGRIHGEVGALDEQGRATAAVYITDKFGEVFGVYRTHENQVLPPVAHLLNWLEFVNSLCPECEPPEWPA